MRVRKLESERALTRHRGSHGQFLKEGGAHRRRRRSRSRSQSESSSSDGRSSPRLRKLESKRARQAPRNLRGQFTSRGRYAAGRSKAEDVRATSHSVYAAGKANVTSSHRPDGRSSPEARERDREIAESLRHGEHGKFLPRGSRHETGVKHTQSGTTRKARKHGRHKTKVRHTQSGAIDKRTTREARERDRQNALARWYGEGSTSSSGSSRSRSGRSRSSSLSSINIERGESSELLS